MNNCKISVIITIYNMEQYLDKCIQSVINQTYKNLEIILVNDGSTDKSFNICKKYAISGYLYTSNECTVPFSHL